MNEETKGLPVVAWLADREAFEERMYATGWRSISDAQHEGCEAFRIELVEALSELTTTAECLDMANESVAQYKAELSELRDVLRRNGFVNCDIGACNCGSYHARYGLPERMSEIKDALSDAGHPLSNDNGNLVSNALAGLIAERDALQAELAAMREQKPVAWIREPDADGMALDWYPGDLAGLPIGTKLYAAPVSAPSQVAAEAVQVPELPAACCEVRDEKYNRVFFYRPTGSQAGRYHQPGTKLVALDEVEQVYNAMRALLATSQEKA